MTKRVLNIVYGLVGLYVSYDTLLRLYQEGTFGNVRPIYFLEMMGPIIGFLKLVAAFCLTTGQVLDFFHKKSAIWFSRVSFLFAVTTLIAIYFIYQKGYIWSYVIDFFVFLLIISIFYLPIVSGETWLRVKRSNTAAL